VISIKNSGVNMHGELVFLKMPINQIVAALHCNLDACYENEVYGINFKVDGQEIYFTKQEILKILKKLKENT
jgi:hypothetical protein